MLSSFHNKILELIMQGEVRISEHGYDELSEDNLTVQELLDGVSEGKTVEEYPEYPKGACILLLQSDAKAQSVHVLWGIPKGFEKPAVLITAYRPNPERWDATLLKRRHENSKEN